MSERVRIAVDIDGTICELRQPGQSYAEVKPLPGACQKLRELKAAGHYIILLTARHMKTCGGNEGLVIARQGKTLLDWLARYSVPYDEIWFGKPHADIYIDDKGYRFRSWREIDGDGRNLPVADDSMKKPESQSIRRGRLRVRAHLG